MSGFHHRLRAAWASSGTQLCVGLDPDRARLPSPLDGAPDGLERFCIEIIDATADLVCAFKPQIAYFASQREEAALERICAYIRSQYPHVTLVLDAKRGDIGATAEHYAREAFGRYAAHAVTVNPYLGTDAVAPFFEHGGGVIGLCRTSNPGGDEIQALPTDRGPVYARVAEMIATDWAARGECGLVVGATYPAELAAVRTIVGDLPILVPGVGAQGGDADEVMRVGRTADGTGLLVNSSRNILYAGSGKDFADAAREAAHTLAAQLTIS